MNTFSKLTAAFFTAGLAILGQPFPASAVEAPIADRPLTVALIDASFGHCGPDWRCDGARLTQYLSALATIGGDVFVPYGAPGNNSRDFLNLAEQIAETKEREFSHDERLDVVIVGMTGEAISDAINGNNNVIPNVRQIVSVLLPYTERVVVMQYVDIGPYNDYAMKVGWPTADLHRWEYWRSRYRSAVQSTGAEFVEIYDAWTPMLPGWHIDSASSYRAALRLWTEVKRQ